MGVSVLGMASAMESLDDSIGLDFSRRELPEKANTTPETRTSTNKIV
jgi:hypothetical protein